MEVVFTGVQELDNLNRNYSKKIKDITDKLCKDIEVKLGNYYASIFPKIRNEILGSYQAVAYIEFQKVFSDCYGKNYDVNSLNKSLNFGIDDNLRPFLLYDAKDFSFSTDFADDRRTFNQNASIEGSFGRLMDFDTLEAIEDISFFGLSFEEDNPYEYAENEMTIQDDYTVFRSKKMLSEPSELYEKAEGQTNQRFVETYNKILKPNIYRKYGIKL